MQIFLSKNPIITLLCEHTKRRAEDFRLIDGRPHVIISRKPEKWRPFHLPVSSTVVWQNSERGINAPDTANFEPDNLYYTDWNKKGLVFPILPLP